MKSNLKPAFCRVDSLLGVVLSLCAVCAQAQSGSEAANYSYFAQLGQGNNAIVTANTQAVANMACVPTATANGLNYLANYAEFNLDLASPFSTSPNSYAQVNNMITAFKTDGSGTETGDQFTGLVSYLGAGGANPSPTVAVKGQYSPATPAGWTAQFTQATPSASYLAQQLNANAAVELGIQWGTVSGGSFTIGRGAHELTLYQISVSSGGTGTISFIDPWGNNANNTAGSSALQVISASLQTINGFLVLTFPTAYVGPDPSELAPTGTAIGGLNGQSARILDDTVEYLVPVPEPATYLAGALLLLPFGSAAVRQLRRKFQAA
jgi:hypothetical protein